MSMTWMSEPRTRANLSQEALAAALSERTGRSYSEKTIARWERGESGKQRNLPYRELAEILDVSAMKLSADHAGDLGVLDDEIASEIEMVGEALYACDGLGLAEGIADALGRESIDSVPAELAKVILCEEGERLPDINGALEGAISRASNRDELERIRRFVGAIALTAVHQAAGDARKFTVVGGITQSWAIRLRINRSRGHGIERFRVEEVEGGVMGGELRIDPEPIRGVPLLEYSKQEPADFRDRVVELVFELGAVLLRPCDPAMRGCGADDRRFEEYCGKLRRHIRHTNTKSINAFAYAVQGEEQEVVDLLMSLLPELHFFIMDSEHDEAEPVLWVDERDLEEWIGLALHDIQEQLESFGGRSGLVMDEADPEFDGDVERLYLSVLRELLAASDRNNQAHQQLRSDVRQLISALEEDGKLPRSGKSWLEKALAGVEGTGKVADLTRKLIDLSNKFPEGLF